MILLMISMISCHFQTKPSEEKENFIEGDTLRATILYGPTSYFNYRGEELGYDYENLKSFADSAGLIIDLKVASSIHEMFLMLENKEVDLIAYPVPVVSPYNDDVIFCGPQEISNQVLVQRKDTIIKDVIDLIGKRIHVVDKSNSFLRLRNLNEEIGGGIDIVTLPSDSIITEDLLEMVNKGEIGYTLIDSNEAQLNGPYYPNLNFELTVGLDQVGSWCVRKDEKSLAAKIDNWEQDPINGDLLKKIYKRYYENLKTGQTEPGGLISFLEWETINGGTSTPYDKLFEKLGKAYDWDPELLSAIAFNESRYNSSSISPFGATGLMQVMPGSALAVGVSPNDLNNPERNLTAAVRILKNLDSSLADKITDYDERIRFVLAGYNAGLGNIFNSMGHAEKLGLDSRKWTGNVSESILLKRNPGFYNTPVIRSSYIHRNETVNFVENVMAVYNYLKSKNKD